MINTPSLRMSDNNILYDKKVRFEEDPIKNKIGFNNPNINLNLNININCDKELQSNITRFRLGNNITNNDNNSINNTVRSKNKLNNTVYETAVYEEEKEDLFDDIYVSSNNPIDFNEQREISQVFTVSKARIKKKFTDIKFSLSEQIDLEFIRKYRRGVLVKVAEILIY